MTTLKDVSDDKPVKRHRLRWTLLILLGVLILALIWFGFTTHPEITALRNIIHSKVVQVLGGPWVMPARKLVALGKPELQVKAA